MYQQPIRVMIVDDHLLMRDGLNALLSTFDEIKVVALASDSEQALVLCAQLQPDVILMDLSMPRMDGPTAIARIHGTWPQVQVIALTSFVEEALIRRTIQAGAIGYLHKNVSLLQLVEAIHAARQGRPTIDAAAAQVYMRTITRPPHPGHDLTERERDVLSLLVGGRTNKEIAGQLALSSGTIRVYVSNILAKLGATNRTEAAALARHYHLIVESA